MVLQFFRTGKYDISATCNGILAGLVAESGRLRPRAELLAKKECSCWPNADERAEPVPIPDASGCVRLRRDFEFLPKLANLSQIPAIFLHFWRPTKILANIRTSHTILTNQKVGGECQGFAQFWTKRCCFSFSYCVFSYISSTIGKSQIPWERCRGVHCVDLGENFLMNIEY